MTSTFMHYITIPFAKEESYKEYVEKALEEFKQGSLFKDVKISYEIQMHGVGDLDTYVEVVYTVEHPDHYRRYNFVGECDFIQTILWKIIRNTLPDIDISKNTKLIAISQSGEVYALYDSTITKNSLGPVYSTPLESVITLNKEDEK